MLCICIHGSCFMYRYKLGLHWPLKSHADILCFVLLHNTVGSLAEVCGRRTCSPPPLFSSYLFVLFLFHALYEPRCCVLTGMLSPCSIIREWKLSTCQIVPRNQCLSKVFLMQTWYEVCQLLITCRFLKRCSHLRCRSVTQTGLVSVWWMAACPVGETTSCNLRTNINLICSWSLYFLRRTLSCRLTAVSRQKLSKTA